MVEGVDYVKCPICGAKTVCLSSNHTRKLHGLSKEEVLSMYPDFTPCCTSRKEKVGKHTREAWKNESTRKKRTENVRTALNSEETKLKISENSKRMWGNMHDELTEKIRKGLNSEEYKAKKSAELKEFWSSFDNKELRKLQIKRGITRSDTFRELHSASTKNRGMTLK